MRRSLQRVQRRIHPLQRKAPALPTRHFHGENTSCAFWRDSLPIAPDRNVPFLAVSERRGLRQVKNVNVRIIVYVKSHYQRGAQAAAHELEIKFAELWKSYRPTDLLHCVITSAFLTMNLRRGLKFSTRPPILLCISSFAQIRGRRSCKSTAIRRSRPSLQASPTPPQPFQPSPRLSPRARLPPPAPRQPRARHLPSANRRPRRPRQHLVHRQRRSLDRGCPPRHLSQRLPR
jgi:hypothetical protein